MGLYCSREQTNLQTCASRLIGKWIIQIPRKFKVLWKLNLNLHNAILHAELKIKEFYLVLFVWIKRDPPVLIRLVLKLTLKPNKKACSCRVLKGTR